MAGGLPPESGFTYLDDVPARVMLDLAHRGARLAKEHGSSAGPPVSLLDQEVIQVSSADVVVGLPMRCVFALTAMGFLPQSAETISADELIRVGYRRRGCVWTPASARFIGIAATRRWCCADGRGWFISGSPSHA